MAKSHPPTTYVRSCVQCDGTGIDYSRANEAVPDPRTGEPIQRGPEPCDYCRGTGDVAIAPPFTKFCPVHETPMAKLIVGWGCAQCDMDKGKTTP